MFRYRFKFETIFLLALVFGLSARAQVRGPRWSAQWEPAKPVNGSPVLFRVTAPPNLKEVFWDRIYCSAPARPAIAGMRLQA
jgi:hypothetical protein